MPKKNMYKTRQREYILECIKSCQDRYVTIQQIADFLKKKECPVGQTTIYRTLDLLTAEKIITKVHIDGVKGTCYRYVSEKTEETFFSMKCEKCGNVIDVRCPELQKLYAHLSEGHHLAIDTKKTMFYGVCDRCEPEKKLEKEQDEKDD